MKGGKWKWWAIGAGALTLLGLGAFVAQARRRPVCLPGQTAGTIRDAMGRRWDWYTTQDPSDVDDPEGFAVWVDSAGTFPKSVATVAEIDHACAVAANYIQGQP